MITLTDTQSLMLATAAQRSGGSLLPLPTSITAPAGGIAKSFASLVKRGAAEERQTSVPTEAHRTENDLRYGLYVTADGLAAIGIADEDGGDGGDTPAGPSACTAPARAELASRVTKSSAVLALLQRDAGATLTELVDATGWLPHTTRAALTGLRKKGHAIERYKRDDLTCYRIASAA